MKWGPAPSSIPSSLTSPATPRRQAESCGNAGAGSFLCRCLWDNDKDWISCEGEAAWLCCQNCSNKQVQISTKCFTLHSIKWKSHTPNILKRFLSEPSLKMVSGYKVVHKWSGKINNLSNYSGTDIYKETDVNTSPCQKKCVQKNFCKIFSSSETKKKCKDVRGKQSGKQLGKSNEV